MLTAQPCLHDTSPTQPSAVESDRPPMRRTRSSQQRDHPRPSPRRTRRSPRGSQPSQTRRVDAPVRPPYRHQPPVEIYAPLPASACHCDAPRGMVYADDDGDLTCALCGHSLVVATPATGDRGES